MTTYRSPWRRSSIVAAFAVLTALITAPQLSSAQSPGAFLTVFRSDALTQPDCSIPIDKFANGTTIDLTNSNHGCSNDALRSLRLSNVKKGTIVEFFDNSRCPYNDDDWSRVTVLADSPSIDITDLEATTVGRGFDLRYPTDGNLNGRVSCIRLVRPNGSNLTKSAAGRLRWPHIVTSDDSGQVVCEIPVVADYDVNLKNDPYGCDNDQIAQVDLRDLAFDSSVRLFDDSSCKPDESNTAIRTTSHVSRFLVQDLDQSFSAGGLVNVVFTNKSGPVGNEVSCVRVHYSPWSTLTGSAGPVSPPPTSAPPTTPPPTTPPGPPTTPPESPTYDCQFDPSAATVKVLSSINRSNMPTGPWTAISAPRNSSLVVRSGCSARDINGDGIVAGVPGTRGYLFPLDYVPANTGRSSLQMGASFATGSNYSLVIAFDATDGFRGVSSPSQGGWQFVTIHGQFLSNGHFKPTVALTGDYEVGSQNVMFVDLRSLTRLPPWPMNTLKLDPASNTVSGELEISFVQSLFAAGVPIDSPATLEVTVNQMPVGNH